MQNQTSNLCLIYPPLSANEFPHLALPTLKSYLTSQGFDKVVVKDFNAPIMDRIIRSNLVKVEKYFADRGINFSLSEIEDKYRSSRQILLGNESGKDNRAFKIINTYLNIAGSNIYDYCFCPVSLQTIKDGYDAVDVETDTNIIISFIRDSLIPYFEQNPAKVVGISIPFSSQIFYALIIGRELKKRFPSTKIILGGPQVSMFYKLISAYKPFREAFDYMFYAQGEVGLAKFLKFVLENEGQIESVPNLIYLDGAEELKINPEKNIEDINDIDEPDFSDLDLDLYIYGKIPYQLSRGCYWGRCEFCSYRDTKGYKVRDLDLILKHVKILKEKYNRRILHFIDDSIPPKILQKLAQRFLDEQLNIKYEAYLRLDKNFTPDLCHLLKKSGLRSALFGFESASQRVLNIMKKGYTVPQIKQVLKNMKEAGIENVISCLIGFPTETQEEAWESIEFLKENRDLYFQAVIVHFGMISDMRYKKDEFGIEAIDFNNLIRYDDTGFCAIGYPYKINQGMSVEDALSLIKKGREYLGISIYQDSFFT